MRRSVSWCSSVSPKFSDRRGALRPDGWALAEGVRDDLGASALFEEQLLEEIRCPNHRRWRSGSVEVVAILVAGAHALFS
jgi:hypothetical protein